MQNNIFIENETVSYNISLPLLLEGESKVPKSRSHTGPGKSR